MRSVKALQTTTLIASIVLGLVVACSGGADGTNGAPGAAGTAGAAGTGGAAGAAGAAGTNGLGGGGGADGGQLILTLSERAQRGLQIAPVALSLQGKTADQIEQIGIGSYLANAMAECVSCHSPDPTKYFGGGLVFPLDATHTVVSRNLTPDPATGLKDTLDQFKQASRNGTDILNSSSALIVHPWQHHRWLSTSDLEAVFSFLQVIPAVNSAYGADNKPPAIGVTFTNSYNEGAVVRALPPETDYLGQPAPDPDSVLRGLAIVPLDIPFPTDPSTLALFGRGSYIINAGAACSACHTNPDRDYGSPTQAVNTAAYMGGGRVIPADPTIAPLVHVVRAMSANLLGQNHGFFTKANVTLQTFLLTITQGVHGEQLLPDGGGARPLSYPMPFQQFRNLTATDLEAVYTYFKYIAGTAPTTGVNDKITQPPARYCADVSGCFPGETCDAISHECAGGACTTDADCGACQTCTGSGSKVCTVPAPDSLCPVLGL